MDDVRPHLVGVGGIGGSGTRVIAHLLQLIGYYIGDDLNDALDNEWFTLLFKRRSALDDDLATHAALFDIFKARMSGVTKFSDHQRRLVRSLIADDRPQHPAAWLEERAASLLKETSPRPVIEHQWGWKEPNTHVVIGRLLAFVPRLHYLHVIRDPFYLAYSQNQHQLETWGALILGHEISFGPRHSLSYWCAVHRRMMDVAARWPGQVMLVDYDRLCMSPLVVCARICEFLNVPSPASALHGFADTVKRPSTPTPASEVDADEFDPEDLAYLAAIGYRTA